MKDFTFQPPAPKVVTPEDVYGGGRLELATKNYHVIDFRYPRKGELFLDSGGMGFITCLISSFDSPRLILEPLPKRKVYTFTETGEGPRHLAPGEYGWYKFKDSDSKTFTSNTVSQGTYTPVTLVES